MKEIVITCALFVAVIFIPALFFAGIQIAYEYGDYSFLIISFPLLISLICYFIFIFVPQKKRQEALRKMHNYPECLQFECGDQWGKTFQIQISKALDNITDLNKKKDLHQCKIIVKKMTDEEAFYKLNKAFRLTGCHLKITDSNGKIIQKIV